MQTGRPFPIFQDRNDINWGDQWRERIKGAIDSISFLIPIVTPSYFQSYMCREEFIAFQRREHELGLPRLILPIYYVSANEIEEPAKMPDEMATVLRERNWSDWRELRFRPLDDPIIREQIATLAKTIKLTMVRLQAEIEASTQSETKPAQDAPLSPQTSVDVESSTLSSLANPIAIPVARVEKFSTTALKRVQKFPYYSYTTKFDEVISPHQFMSSEEILLLHKILLKIVRTHTSKFDEAIKRTNTEIASASKEQDIAITILIDNSGSMRGKKILDVATWIYIASSILSSADISYEILGFTTKAWKGGQSRELWLSDGKPALPGRLNDLRHIVYKRFDETFQEANIKISAMTREGLLKENIDGEALLWAYTRLQRRHAERKILVVLSDGAPVDDSTLSVSNPGFLSRHLKLSAGWIRSVGDIELYGVGIGKGVSIGRVVASYYGEGSPTLDELQIGPDLLSLLSAILRKDIAALKEFQKAALHPVEPEMPRPAARRRRTKTASGDDGSK